LAGQLIRRRAPITGDFFAKAAITCHIFGVVPEAATVFLLCFGAVIFSRKR
jgi:hypothetical protein